MLAEHSSFVPQAKFTVCRSAGRLIVAIWRSLAASRAVARLLCSQPPHEIPDSSSQCLVLCYGFAFQFGACRSCRQAKSVGSPQFFSRKLTIAAAIWEASRRNWNH